MGLLIGCHTISSTDLHRIGKELITRHEEKGKQIEHAWQDIQLAVV